MRFVQKIWHNHPFYTLQGEGNNGTAAQQIETLFDQAEHALEPYSLTMEDAVFIRFWMRDRSISDAVRAVRTRRLSCTRRVASSSFFAEDHFLGTGQVAIDLIAMPPALPHTRRLVDFNPPRRYAHYLIQDGWLFLSGMAEQGVDIVGQLAAIFEQIERALAAEAMAWPDVQLVEIYVERDLVDAADVLEKLMTTAGTELEIITIRTVDGLASTNKNLEIEVIATRSI